MFLNPWQTSKGTSGDSTNIRVEISWETPNLSIFLTKYLVEFQQKWLVSFQEKLMEHFLRNYCAIAKIAEKTRNKILG